MFGIFAMDAFYAKILNIIDVCIQILSMNFDPNHTQDSLSFNIIYSHKLC